MKKASFVIKIISSSLLFLAGIIIMLIGLLGETSLHDLSLGAALEGAVSAVYFWRGLLITLIGAYLFACPLAYVEPKKRENHDERTFELLCKYKEFLDLGIITQEEYENKKRQLLDLE